MSARVVRFAALGLAALSLWGASAARAEEPEGEYTIPFEDEAALSVPFASSSACTTARGVETCLTLPMRANPFGSLEPADPNNPNALVLTIESADIESDLHLTSIGGVLSGTNQKPKAQLDFGASGSITEGGVTLDAVSSGSVQCKLHRELADTLECRGKLTLCVFAENGDQLGCTRLPIATHLALQRRAFDLELDLATDGSTVTGSALVRFDEDQAFPRTVTGKYNPGGDTVNLNLTGFDNGLASKLTLKGVRLEEGGASGGKVVYKLAGQQGSVKLPQ